MSDNVELLETPHREYDADRDWLAPDGGLRRSAEVVRLTPKFLHCSICGSHNHRASACSQRPRIKSPTA